MVFPGPISRDIGAMRSLTFFWLLVALFVSSAVSGSEQSDGRPSEANPEVKKSRRFISHSSSNRFAANYRNFNLAGENITHPAFTFNAPDSGDVTARIIRRSAASSGTTLHTMKPARRSP